MRGRDAIRTARNLLSKFRERMRRLITFPSADAINPGTADVDRVVGDPAAQVGFITLLAAETLWTGARANEPEALRRGLPAGQTEGGRRPPCDWHSHARRVR
jgi:hypothetical protein